MSDETSVKAMDEARQHAQYGRLGEVVALLESGAVSVDSRDSDGCTLLQWAAINNRESLVDELVERGADVNLHGGVLDESALQWAMRHGHTRTIVRLREAGADAMHRGNEGGNAVHLACRYAKVAPQGHTRVLQLYFNWSFWRSNVSEKAYTLRELEER